MSVPITPVIVLLAFSFVGFAHAKNRSLQVVADGCPFIGERNSCIGLDLGNGTKYDISSANPRVDPTQHLGVGVYAQKTAKTSACGVVLQNIRWSYTKQVCR